MLNKINVLLQLGDKLMMLNQFSRSITSSVDVLEAALEILYLLHLQIEHK